MVKVKVRVCFLDVNDNSIVYNVGDVLTFEDTRAAECEARGLVNIVAEEKAKPGRKPKSK